jgi:hypothetical protein
MIRWSDKHEPKTTFPRIQRTSVAQVARARKSHSTGSARDSRSAVRELQSKNDLLERQLRRKDKALAEAAALLVLQKKFQALWAHEV